MSASYFQGDTVTGSVRAATAKTFKEVVAELRKCVLLPLTRDAFFRLDQKQRDKKKHVSFFVPAVFKQSPSPRNYANASHCNLIFLDIDPLPDGTCPAAPFVKDPALLLKRLAPFNSIAHLTASSTPEKPRMRVIVDANAIALADYAKAVATIGAMLGLPSITRESSVAVQPMFRPIRFKDSPAKESPIIAVREDGRAFVQSDITENQGAPAPSKNGANGNHAPEEADELENLVAPDPDFTLAMAKEALDAINPDLPRPEWIKIAAALRHQFSPQQEEEALELFDKWSAEGKKYEGEAETTYLWNSFRQTPKGRHPITIGTLAKLAEEGGWVDPRKQKKEKAVLGYYDSAKKEFLIKNEGGRWLSHGTDGFKRYLRKMGFSTKIPEGKPLSPAEEVMEAAINRRDVRYAGPLAGRPAGFYEEGGVRFLVTESPVLVIPVKGDCPTILKLFTELLGSDPEHGTTQLATFFSWLKMAFESLKAGKRQPGQALALAGPIQCGKSLAQGIITEVLGGRSAKAMRYMSGLTPFNSELFGAEHLVLEDESSSTDVRARMNMAARIKEVTVNDVHSCHAKHREAVSLRPFWWMSISLNNEPEALLVLPPMRQDVADKIILLLCAMPATPFPTGSYELRSAYWRSIVSEIPAFAQFLIDYQIPAHLRDTRFGVRYFHHPELLEGLRSLAPETKLLELIDRAIFHERKTPWEGSAGDLESALRNQYSGVSEEAGRLFHWSTACGVYLGKLADKADGRVHAKRNREKRTWVIQPPSVVDLNDF